MTDGMQAAERFNQLLSRLLEGGLGPEALHELSDLAHAEPEFLEIMAEHLILDSLLSEELGSGSMADLVDLVTAPCSDSLEIPDSTRKTGTLIPGGFWRRAAWAAAAAMITIMVFYIGQENAGQADAATAVQAAILAHSSPVERVYTVQVERDTDSISGFMPPRDVLLMTQGDQFYVEMERGGWRWVWGRDADGAIWMKFGANRTLIIGGEELGTSLRYIAELYSLNLESLLRGALSNYRLEYSSVEGPTRVIRAEPRADRTGGTPEFSIELDRETKAIRQLVIQRESAEYGPATVIFTLVDARIPDESKYAPEGHLSEPYRVLTSRDQPDIRRALLLRRFGPAAQNWIVNKE